MTADNIASLNRWELENRVLVQAIFDPADYRRLVADPKAVLAAAIGADLPDGVTARLIVEEKDRVHFVVPNPQNAFMGALEARSELLGASGRLTRRHLEASILAAVAGDVAALRESALRRMREAIPTLPAEVTLEVVEEAPGEVVLSYPYVGRSSYR